MILADIGVHYVIAFRSMLFRRCTPELFAVYDNLFFRKRVKELPAMLNQTSLNLIGIHSTHQPLESVRRRAAVRTLGKQTEITRPIISELAHVHIILASADIGQQGDCQKVGKRVCATTCNPMIGYCHKDFV